MKTQSRLSQLLAAPIISLTIVFSTAIGASTAHAEPYITFTPPGGKPRQVDCGTLKLPPDGNPQKASATCEFGKQIDINNTDMCGCQDLSSGTATALYLQHLATNHGGDCGRIYGMLLLRAGKNPEKVLGEGWQDLKNCSLLEAVSLCAEALEAETMEQQTPTEP